MAMTAGGNIPRGLDDLGVYTYPALLKVDVPGIRTLAFTVASDSDQLEGDNSVIAVVRNPKSLTGSIEMGMINLAALAALVGGSVQTGGAGTSETLFLDESSASPALYCRILGQANSQDVNGTCYRADLKKVLVVSGPDETMGVNAWNTPTINFEGVAVGGVLLTRTQFEDALTATLPAGPLLA
jgi:hypothetical protein